jgi:oxygen-independent coproporphyrinogen III oxidase
MPQPPSSVPLEAAHPLQRLDRPAPSYTSYPTADRFVEAFGSVGYAQALRQRQHPVNAKVQPLAVYVHIPFCESLCYFCKCNKVITGQHQRAAAYLRYLEREVALHRAEMGSGQAVSQLHLGGGTPTFLSDGELEALMVMLRRSFTLASDGDYSIEVDPRTVDAKRIRRLAELGFNRVSFGLQDFDGAVQKAVNRVQSAQTVHAVVSAARLSGFTSVGVDLICGLPRQSPESFSRTVAMVTALRPDRIAMHAYDHAPVRFTPQRRIASADLPAAAARQTMLSNATQAFIQAGYVYIGVDDFALPTDLLALAKRQGRLYRSWNGFSSQPDGDVIGLGVSAAGRVGATYSHNTESIAEYYDLLDQGQFPVVRGLTLTRDDLVRRAVIMALMCQGQLSFEAIELSYLLDFPSYFAVEMTALRRLAEQDLVVLDGAGIQLAASGLLALPRVAMVFDQYLQNDYDRARFAQII